MLPTRAHLQPVVEIARRPQVLRRDERAHAGPERARERDGPVGRVAIQRDVHPSVPGIVRVRIGAEG
jgi:hypothetical protein